MERDLKELLQQVKDSEVTVRENLEEISRKQKELAKEKAEAASSMAFEKQTSAAVQKSRQTKEQREVRERIEEQQTGQTGADFKPFVPEKIETAPKKRRGQQRRRKNRRQSLFLLWKGGSHIPVAGWARKRWGRKQ